MPRTLKQSARFGVKPSSIIASSSFRYLRISSPNGASAGNSIKPSDFSASPSSCSAHNMPNDSTPRSLAFLILKSPGNTAPSVASGILMPGRAFAAPHTICTSSTPLLTRQTCSFSASGWGSAATISATTTPEKLPATGSIASTSRPAIVNRAANCSVSTAGFTHSRNHCSLNFIFFPSKNFWATHVPVHLV